MVIVESVVALIILVLLSSIIGHYVTKIPISLIQILLGLIVAIFFKFKIQLDTNWFLLLFIAPLLFNDGRDFPKHELWELKGPIFENAILLVFVTTIVGGYFVHMLVPSMSLAACFALIAILSPTDPIAVQSISKRVDLPKNILHLVSGESLINDASGLIAFKYAIAAVVTGYFSWKLAVGDFFYTVIVGLIVGVVGMSLIIAFRNLLRVIHFSDVAFNVVLQILTPFIIYIVAESFLHSSGVIAVVAAGIIDHLQMNPISSPTPEINLMTSRTWDVIVYCLNGIVFIILGIELPVATKAVINGNKYGTWISIGLAFAVWFILLVIRMAWIYGYEAFSYYVTKSSDKKPKFKVALLAGISGVRGAITMAGVLSIPVFLANGKLFPDRELMLFVAALVIVISLLAATILLPIIAPDSDGIKTRASLVNSEGEGKTKKYIKNRHYISTDSARVFLIRNAIASLEHNKNDDNERAVYDIILDYQVIMRRLIRNQQDEGTEMRMLSQELSLRRVGLEGKRAATQRLLKEKKIGKDAYWIANRRINRQERRIIEAGGIKLPKHKWYYQGWLFSLWHSIKNWQLSDSESRKTKKDLHLITEVGDQAAIDAIYDFLKRNDINEKNFDAQMVRFIVTYYQSQIERAKSYEDPDEDDEQYEYQVVTLRSKAMEAERKAIEQLVDEHKISPETGLDLRQDINFSEMLMLNDD